METAPTPLMRNRFGGSPDEEGKGFNRTRNLTTEREECLSQTPQRKPSFNPCLSDSGFHESMRSFKYQ